jgi:GNAT superfamily N-acetyltransferase
VREDELIELADLNFAESLWEKARWCAAGEAAETSGTLCIASATRLAVGPFNAAMGTSATGPEILERARRWYAARDRGFTLYLRGARDAELVETCRAAGLTQLGDMPGMVLERPPAIASAVELVDDDAGRATFVDVCIAAWESMGLKAAAFQKHFADPRLLNRPHLKIALARDAEGRACATALAFLSHGIAGIYWVGTRPDARGRGLGEAVTSGVARWAFDHGARAVVLQASAQGEPVYRRMGFRVITRYPWFVAQRAA